MLCALILYMSGGTYSKSRLLTTDFWGTFHGNFIYSQSFCQKFAERKSIKKYFFIFSFWCLIWGLNPGLMSNKPPHYLLDYDDFRIAIQQYIWGPGQSMCWLLIFRPGDYKPAYIYKHYSDTESAIDVKRNPDTVLLLSIGHTDGLILKDRIYCRTRNQTQVPIT